MAPLHFGIHPISEFPVTLVYASPTECWNTCARVDWMLDLIELGRQAKYLSEITVRELRAFACWTGRSVWHLCPTVPAQQALLTAEAVVRGEADAKTLVKAWRDTAQIAEAAGCSGYFRRRCDAAATLASAHAANPSAVAGAFLGSHYSILAKVWHHVPVPPWSRPYPHGFLPFYLRHEPAGRTRQRWDVTRLAEEEVRQAFSAEHATALRPSWRTRFIAAPGLTCSHPSRGLSH
jgi:hypothetical protein